jgi:hypothetical protein
VEAKDFVNPRNIWYRPVFGKVMEDRNELTDQFKRFSAFVDTLTTRLTISQAHQGIGEAIVKLLNFTINHAINFDEMNWYLDRVVARLSMSSLFLPDDDLNPSPQTEKIVLDNDMIFSALVYMNFSALTEVTARTFIEVGWATHENFNKLNNLYVYASKYLTGNTYSRKDFFKYALSKVNDSTGFISLLKTKLIDEDQFRAVVMPGSEYVTKAFKNKFALSLNFINDNKKGFGVLDNFIYDASPTFNNNSHFQRFFETKEPSSTVDYLELQRLIASERFNKLFVDNKMKSTALLINVPINYLIEEVKEWHKIQTPIKLPTASTVLSFSPLRINFSSFDYIINDDKSDYLDQGFTAWHSNILQIFIGYDINFVNDLYRVILTPRRDSRLITMSDFGSSLRLQL